jgi:hypothetical protein
LGSSTGFDIKGYKLKIKVFPYPNSNAFDVCCAMPFQPAVQTDTRFVSPAQGMRIYDSV